MEWTVVTTIVVIAGLVAAVVKPIVTLTTTLAKLTSTAEQLDKRLVELTEKNTNAHERLWAKNSEQDKRIELLEGRS